jgi:hypothetical protein
MCRGIVNHHSEYTSEKFIRIHPIVLVSGYTMSETKPTEFVLWRMTWNDNGPQSAEAWVPKGQHPADTELWGLINYAEMHDDEYTVEYEEVDTNGQASIRA